MQLHETNIIIVVILATPFGTDIGAPVVCTSEFCVSGFVQNSTNGYPIYSYQTIPYAEPPIGSLRFMPPVPITYGASTINGTADMPFCHQFNIFGPGQIMGQEDCLYLSVFSRRRPGNSCNTGLPVMVWIYGGAFLSGGGSPSMYDPRVLLREEIVMVSMNYRLGAFGFLSTADDVIQGNMGLKDQNLALKWVQQYIAYFCGNPNRVTIAGESAGSVSVHYHMLSPMSEGLFQQAILQSGTASYSYWAYQPPNKALARAKQAAGLLNCPSDNSTIILECMQASTANDLAGLYPRTTEWDILSLVPFAPTKEVAGSDRFMAKSPQESMAAGDMANVTLMAGICDSEGDFLGSGIWRRGTYWEINNNYSYIFPILMSYEQCAADANRTSNMIRKYYFKFRSISNATISEFIKMVSDSFIISGSYKTIRDHVALRAQQFPTYFYMYTFRGPITVSQQTGFVTGGPEYQPQGTSHFDDMYPLFWFPPSNLLMQEGSPMRRMSDKMVSWWTNFISYGNPTPPGGKESDVTWDPVEVESFNVFNMSLTPLMQTRFFYRRVEFWESINLQNPDCFK